MRDFFCSLNIQPIISTIWLRLNSSISPLISFSISYKFSIPDTISPTAYARVLKEVEYSDMMIVNTGNYSTSIDIYKEDSLYIHDNVPVRLNEDSFNNNISCI